MMRFFCTLGKELGREGSCDGDTRTGGTVCIFLVEVVFSLVRGFCLFVSSLESFSKHVEHTRNFFSVEMCLSIIRFLEQLSHTTSPQLRQ